MEPPSVQAPDTFYAAIPYHVFTITQKSAEERLARIGIYEQKFLFDDHKKKDINSVDTTVSKLGYKVNRLTGGKHKFTKE